MVLLRFLQSLTSGHKDKPRKMFKDHRIVDDGHVRFVQRLCCGLISVIFEQSLMNRKGGAN